MGHRKDADRVKRDKRKQSSGYLKAHVAGHRKFLAQGLLNRNEGHTFPYVLSAQPVRYVRLHITAFNQQMTF